MILRLIQDQSICSLLSLQLYQSIPCVDGKTAVTSSNVAGLFWPCFLVAVTQHAGLSICVIIRGKNGNPWQLMQGLDHVRSAKVDVSMGGDSH